MTIYRQIDNLASPDDLETVLDWLTQPLAELAVYEWETFFGNWFLYLSLAFLAFELVRYVVMRRMNWKLAGDTVANFVTFGMFAGVTYLLLAGVYIGAYFYFHQFAILDIEINWATIALCVVAADLAYYWEHRFTHRAGIAWATHTVHHSSPHFNISVAYRFGPLDALWPIFFHVPLILIGFNPFIVFFAETFLHTEVIKKFPRPIEFLMNTPSHHRVHHGANERYIDKNYGGIFIIWDRIFGTFAEEKEKVVYGITQPVDTVNPITIFFHGLSRLGKQVAAAKGLRNKLLLLAKPPGWSPEPSRVARAGQQSHEASS